MLLFIALLKNYICICRQYFGKSIEQNWPRGHCEKMYIQCRIGH